MHVPDISVADQSVDLPLLYDYCTDYSYWSRDLVTYAGRVSGECYVELTCKEDVEGALRKDHQYIGERWVSVAKATREAMDNDVSKCELIQREYWRGEVLFNY